LSGWRRCGFSDDRLASFVEGLVRDIGPVFAATHSSAVGLVVLSVALNGWRRWWRRGVDRCMGNESPVFSASYNGATLDVMVAFSRRPIVLSSREEELLSTRLLDHLSLVATTSPHDRTASVFIQFLQIGSKKQSVWFTPFVRANPCHVCVFVCVCITTEMPGDCCLCSSICLDVPSRQRRL